MSKTNNWKCEYTDTFGGEANYSWVRRADVAMPELTHYGYDGATNYAKANAVYQRELARKVKAAFGLSGVRGRSYWHGDQWEFRPYRSCTVVFAQFDYV